METFAKAAGVEEQPPPSTTSTAPGGGGGGFAQDKDLEAGRALQSRPSKASLPLSRGLSQPSSERNGEPPTGGADEELPWGPSHPCFPHPNPHVPLSSPLVNATRIIRIKRDWMVAGDLYPAFTNMYPEILDPLLPEDEFRGVIQYINDELKSAFNPLGWRAIADTALGLATLWLWEDAGLAGVKGQLKKLEAWIEVWNARERAKAGAGKEDEAPRIWPLRRTGYMTLDIQIPDPGIDFINANTDSRPGTQATDPGITPVDAAVTSGPAAAPVTRDFGPYPVRVDPQQSESFARDHGERDGGPGFQRISPSVAVPALT